MKILLILIIIACFCYVGFCISKYYKKRNKFFCSLLNVIEKVNVDINYSNKNLCAIFNNELTDDVNIKKLISNFCEYLENKTIVLDEKQLFKGINIVKPDEKNIILDFFNQLGRHDAQNEIKLINNFKTVLMPIQESASMQLKKYGPMSFKLSTLFGLLLAILLI